MYNPTKGERSWKGEERREGRGNICIIRQVNVYSDRERASMQSLWRLTLLLLPSEGGSQITAEIRLIPGERRNERP